MTMATENRESTEKEVPEQAAQYTLAANPLVGIRGQDIFKSAQMLIGKMMSNPGLAAEQYLSFLKEVGKIMAGQSTITPDVKDKRFGDPAWKENTTYRALAQYYLAWSGALDRYVDELKLHNRDSERAHFVVSLFVDAMAPTNMLGGNPAALKKFAETGGGSLVRGLENFINDMVRNNGLPMQVDATKFAIGKNLATTPGSVVYRNPVMELIQYSPMVGRVHQRPLLIAPPQINKFYVFDLEPKKSIMQMALKGGLQTFAISWKNPTREQSHFGMETYVGALEEAVDAMRAITGSDDVNVWGSCSGGIVTSAFLAHLAARQARKVFSATVAVCMLDMDTVQHSSAGAFITPEAIMAAKTASQLQGVMEGQELARMFAWMRPNDLIWNYWVNNYLMGNAPPAFDILYWNSDTTRLSRQLHSDFLDLIETNPFVKYGQLMMRGTPLDMRKIDMDSYIVGGTTDHITPWQACYKSARLFGERSTFVLSNSGHIQSLLNPPGNPKASFWSNPAQDDAPQAWFDKAIKHQGSWWPHWLEWIQARSGELIDAPAALGSPAYQPLGDAPGQYVLEK
jgi:polyhydroxyalkanoate synthase